MLVDIRKNTYCFHFVIVRDLRKPLTTKSMKTKLLLFGLFVSSFVNAQSPTFEWAKSITSSYVKNIYDITTDASGNVFTTGTLGLSANIGPDYGTLEAVINPNNLNANMARNVFVTKMSASGALIWAKTFGGEYDDYGRGIKTDPEGNV